jgi:tetratricopeptide (TPR) repeat protein
LGNALRQLERWQEAVDAYRQATRLNPEFPWSWFYLGEGLVRLECWHEAVEALQQAVRLQEDLPGVDEWLADALRMRAKIDLQESVGYYRRAISANPDKEKLYHKALDAKPDDADLYLQLGNVLSRQGRWDGAIAFYQMALQFDPENVEASSQLDNAFANQG